MPEPTMSMRVVRPFLEVMRDKGVPSRILRFLEEADPDARLSTRAGLAMLEDAVRITRDPDLGLLAAMRTGPGDHAALEYVVASCTSVREALEMLTRYFFVAYENSGVNYECKDGRVFLEYYRPSGPQCRAAIDYALAISYIEHRRWTGGDSSQWEVWFPYPTPERVDVHRKLFEPSVRLRFGAPRGAFVFPESELSQAPESSDRKLNELLVRYVEERYVARPPRPSLMAQVRSMILRELDGGNPAADPIAVELGVSRRTLTRRLEEEGTSFKRLLSDVRCAMAVRYLIVDELSIADVVKRLGYSEAAAFHKAFKRWLGVTPVEYLRRHRERATIRVDAAHG